MTRWLCAIVDRLIRPAEYVEHLDLWERAAQSTVEGHRLREWIAQCDARTTAHLGSGVVRHATPAVTWWGRRGERRRIA